VIRFKPNRNYDECLCNYKSWNHNFAIFERHRYLVYNFSMSDTVGVNIVFLRHKVNYFSFYAHIKNYLKQPAFSLRSTTLIQNGTL
jgi:hypothetical protein